MSVNEIPSGVSGGKTAPLFRLSYIILPLAVLVLSLILVGVFYSNLPEETGWIFRDNGLPEKWLDKRTLVLWTIVIQIILLTGAVSITAGTAWIFNRYGRSEKQSLNLVTVLTLMGNMVGMPQLIIFFALLDIFSYNSYRVHVMPLWLNALLFLLGGGIIIGVFFLRILSHIRRTDKEYYVD